MPSDAADRISDMSRYLLTRSMIESPVQHSAGIFQFGTNRLFPSVEALTLAGAMATAHGAPLGDREFDVHTWLRHEFVKLGTPEDNAVPFTGYAVARALYGNQGGKDRKLITHALTNLTRALVTIPGFDASTGEISPDAVSHDLRLLEGVVTRGHYRQFVAALKRGESPTNADFAELTKMRGDATMIAMLPKWSADAIRAGHSRPLDLDAQRELGGVAKRVWVQLDAQTFTEDPTNPEHENYVLELDRERYSALGLQHRRPVDRKRYLTKALQRIRTVDPTYTEATVELHPNRQGTHILNVTRCYGKTRDKRLHQRYLQTRNPQKQM